MWIPLPKPGRYICFTSQDDFSSPELNQLDKHNCNVSRVHLFVKCHEIKKCLRNKSIRLRCPIVCFFRSRYLLKWNFKENWPPWKCNNNFIESYLLGFVCGFDLNPKGEKSGWLPRGWKLSHHRLVWGNHYVERWSMQF